MLNTMRKLLCFFMATVLATFALPSGAAGEKIFYALFPDVVLSGTAVPVNVTFVNVSAPPGVSTINSIKILAPLNVTINNVVPGTGSGTLSGPFAEPTLPGQQYWVVTNFTGIKRGEQKTFQFSVNTSANASCAPANWGAEANTGNSYPQGDSFIAQTASMKLTSGIGCDGILKCPSLPTGDPGIYNFTQVSGGNITTGLRLENKDASVCIPILFNVGFSASDRTVLIEWDMNTQPYATLDTTTTWPRELVETTSGLPKRTRVAWEFSSPGVPRYLQAPACLVSDPPVPYGTLGVAITSDGTTSIVIVATSLPTAPFPIVIASNEPGVDPERMLVTGYTAGPAAGVFTAYVIRGSGMTEVSNHSLGAKVVSTPLPIVNIPLNYYNGKQAQVCIIEEVFSAQPLGTAGCPTQAAGAEPLACVQVETHLYVIGDPYVTRD